MIPHIDHVSSVEMIRDGGSLAASWSTEGIKFWLFFEVEFNSEQDKRMRYSTPVIVNRQIGTSEAVSWGVAERILATIKPELELDSDLKWLSAMEEVAAAKGKLPSAVSANVAPWKRLGTSDA